MILAFTGCCVGCVENSGGRFAGWTGTFELTTVLVVVIKFAFVFVLSFVDVPPQPIIKDVVSKNIPVKIEFIIMSLLKIAVPV